MKPSHAFKPLRQPSQPVRIRVSLRSTQCLVAIRERVEKALRKAEGVRSFSDCFPDSVGPTTAWRDRPYVVGLNPDDARHAARGFETPLDATIVDCTVLIRAREAKKDALMVKRCAAHMRPDPVAAADAQCTRVGARVEWAVSDSKERPRA